MLCIKPHWTWAIPQTICIGNISWPSRVSDEWWGQVLTIHLHWSFNQKLGTFLKNLVLFRPQEPENLFLHLQKLSTQGVVLYEDPGSFWGRFAGLRNSNCLCSCSVLFHQHLVCRYKLAIFFSDSFYLLPHLYISTANAANLLCMLIQWIQLLCNAAQLHAFPCYLANCIAIQMIMPSVSLHRVIVVQPLSSSYECLLGCQCSVVSYVIYLTCILSSGLGVDGDWQQEPFSSSIKVSRTLKMQIDVTLSN